tara:strand:- start:473 stop:1150 length:678 start_codon:yes stop_codon:yes gene_type:complete
MAINKNKFKEVTKLVIDNLEGGYFNPLWHNVKDTRYNTSGETMFGIDRKNGGYLNTTPSGLKFWALIDKNKNQKVWKWNYTGGALNKELTDLTSEIIYPEFVKLENLYLKPKAIEIVNNNNKLLFNFIYATWNGAGWFKKFATDLNEAIAKGETNTEKLIQVVLNSRLNEGLKKNSKPNSLIAQGGKKIANLFKINLPLTEKKKIIPLLITILTTIFLIHKYKKQ